MSEPAAAGPIRIPDDLRATLVLVRHGQSTFVAEGRFQGRLDPPLSDLGERQAALVADWLAAPDGPPGLGLVAPPLEIAHSPLVRTARSAAAIGAAFDRRRGSGPSPALRPEPAFVELSQGEWEGLSHADVAARWGELLESWRRNPTAAWAPGGESLAAADGRVRGALPGLLERLQAPPPDPDAERSADRHAAAWSVVVAHDGILRILLLALLDLPLERFWAFPFVLAGVSVLDLGSGRAALRAHNLAGHLVEAGEVGLAGSAQPDRGGAL